MRLKPENETRLLLEVPKLDPRLAVILLHVDAYHGREIIITHLHRTQVEQDEIYENHPLQSVREKYKSNPWVSVHQCLPVRGADLRADDRADEIANFINRHWQYDPNRPAFLCAIVHDSGHGRHIHVQTHLNTIYII